MQTQSSADRITTSLSFAHRRGEKQLSSNLTLYKLTQATGPTLGEQKPKEREFNPEAWEKKTTDTISLKKMKRQRNTTQMKEQTRKTEVQINEEEIGKLPEKEFRIMIAKMIKNLENRMEKMQESINKDLEELKNKYTETNNTITEIKIF